MIDYIKSLDIVPNAMQSYIINRLFGLKYDYKRAFIMAGMRSGKSTLIDMIAFCHIKSYTVMSTPKILIVTTTKSQQDIHKEGLLKDNPYIYYTTPRSYNLADNEYTLILLDDIECIQSQLNYNNFITFMKKLCNACNGNMIITGRKSEYLTHLILKHLTDDDTLCAAFNTWDAIVNKCDLNISNIPYCTVGLIEPKTNCHFFKPVPDEVLPFLSDHDRTCHTCRYTYDEGRWHHDLYERCRCKEAIEHCIKCIEEDAYVI